MEKRKRGRPRKIRVLDSVSVPNNWNVILKANYTEYAATGSTLEEACAFIPLFWTQVKTKAILVISDGVRKAEKILFLKQARLFLRSPLRRAGVLKQCMSLLK